MEKNRTNDFGDLSVLLIKHMIMKIRDIYLELWKSKSKIKILSQKKKKSKNEIPTIKTH